MLARYRITRGRRPPDDPLPAGVRVDTRKHTRHVLAPQPDMVKDLLEDPSDPERVARFRAEYRALLERRMRTEGSRFDALARRAREEDVYLGCSCPTKRQPHVEHCHTVEALRFMQERYPELDVRLPASRSRPASR